MQPQPSSTAQPIPAPASVTRNLASAGGPHPLRPWPLPTWAAVRAVVSCGGGGCIARSSGGHCWAGGSLSTARLRLGAIEACGPECLNKLVQDCPVPHLIATAARAAAPALVAQRPPYNAPPASMRMTPDQWSASPAPPTPSLTSLAPRAASRGELPLRGGWGGSCCWVAAMLRRRRRRRRLTLQGALRPLHRLSTIVATPLHCSYFGEPKVVAGKDDGFWPFNMPAEQAREGERGARRDLRQA